MSETKKSVRNMFKHIIMKNKDEISINNKIEIKLGRNMKVNPAMQREYLINLLNRIPQSEQQLQSKCAELLYFFYPDHWKRLVCVHNNSLRANTQGFGIVPGASDMYWIGEAGKTVFIEFKFGKNRQSIDQTEWQYIIERLGHDYRICYLESTFWNIVSFNQPCEADIENLKWFA